MQVSVTEKLEKELTETQDPVKRSDLLNTLAWEINRSAPPRANEFATEALTLSQGADYLHGVAFAKQNLGSSYIWISKNEDAQGLLFEAHSLFRELGDKKHEAQVAYNIATNFYYMADYDNALKYFMKSYGLNQLTGNRTGIADSLNGMGTVYYTINENEKALDSLQKALSLSVEAGDKVVRPKILSGLGTTLNNMDRYEEALIFMFDSLDILQKTNGSRQIQAFALNEIGRTYLKLGDYGKAMEYFTQALDIRNEIGFKNGAAESLVNIGRIHFLEGDPVKALDYAERALALALEVKSLEPMYQSYEFLSEIYEQKQDHRKALEYFKLFTQAKEELKSDRARQKSKSLETQLKMEQAEDEKELLRLKNEELEKYSQDVTLLSDIGVKITSCLSVESIIDTVYEEVNTLMDAPCLGIGIVDAVNNKLTFPGYVEKGLKLPTSYSLDDFNRLAIWCLRNKKEILMGDFRNDATKYVQHIVAPVSGESTESIIYYPLLVKNRTIGVITVQSFQKNIYTQYHLNIIKNLAVYTAIALENASLYEDMEAKVQQRTEEINTRKEQIEKTYNDTKLLSQIGQRLTSTLDFTTLFEKLHENVKELMPADCFGVRIYHPETSILEYKYEIEKGEVLEPLNISMDDDNNLSVWCVKNKRELYSNDIERDYKLYVRSMKVVDGEMPCSLIIYPLMAADRIIGVITVQSFDKNAYIPYHLDILRTLASYTAIALDNAALYGSMEEKVKERTNELIKQKEEVEKTYNDTKLLSQIGKDITAALSVEVIIDRVYKNVNTLMDAATLGIGIYDQDKKEIYFPATIEKSVRLPRYSYSIDNQDRPAVWCYTHQKEIFIESFTEEFVKSNKVQDYQAKYGENPESIIYVPIILNEKILGVLTVQSFTTHAYSNYHLNILKNLAVYIAIAIDNASLYKNMEDRVEERTQEVVKRKEEIEKTYHDTRLLSQIAKDISSSLSVEVIIEKVYENVNTLMDATCFGIGIYNQSDKLEFRGFVEKKQKLDDFYFLLSDLNRLAVMSFNNEKEIFINDYEKEYKKYIAGIKAPVAGQDCASIIYLPLYVKEKKMGVITVQSFERNAYTQYHLDILRNLAVSVAIALDNANLYQNLEEKVRERTDEVVRQKEQIEKTFGDTKLISEIGKEISATLSVEEIISKVYKSINSLMDATIFGIALHREEQNDLFFSGVMEKGERLPDFSYKMKEKRIAVICYNTGQEIIINDWEKEYKKYVAKDYSAKHGDMPESMIYIPLLSKGRVIGVISVQSFSKNAYNDYSTNVLRSLAVYVGSAIENANLYKGMEDRVNERTAEIDKAYQNTKLLSQISKDITSSLSIETIVSKVYENVNNLMDGACFGIGIYHPETDRISFPGFIEDGVSLQDVSFAAKDDRLACWCFQNQKEIFINDFEKEYKKYVKGRKKVIAGKQSSSIIYLPLFNKGAIIGVITVQSYRKNAYTDYHMDILRNLAHAVAIALENATLYGNLEGKVKERTAEVVKQKEIIEEKNKHITDSILYAKRIQQAILPSESFIKECLPDSFVIYKPKDIVSGDFYWLERKDNKILFAVVDCTGHGVPGAFMSIVGYNGLNQAVNEYGFRSPADILNRLNLSVSETLHQKSTESSIRDGMDIALCSLDLKKRTLEFAGAFNPVYIIRGKELMEVKADKQPIGAFVGERLNSFTNHVIDLKKGDQVYISSDGYADQFGGTKGKKFMRKNFKELLLKNRRKAIPEQSEILQNTFETWRGKLEQVDDICVIGLKVS